MFVCMLHALLIRRQAAEVDGKAQNSLMKLQLFRQFYVMVVIYIYFTRIVVYLLTSTIPFYLLWMGPVCVYSDSLPHHKTCIYAVCLYCMYLLFVLPMCSVYVYAACYVLYVYLLYVLYCMYVCMFACALLLN